MIKKITLLSTLLMTSPALLAQVCSDTVPESHFAGQFVDKHDGTIIDVKNSLVWQKCNFGENYNELTNACDGKASDLRDWKSALEAAQTVTEFNLPNIHELASLVDYSCYSPSSDLSIFPTMHSSPYWSSTGDFLNTNAEIKAYVIDFFDGQEVDTRLDEVKYIRLVKPLTHE
ncbi:Lcl C-terminal domain-containing protein [Aliivibrio wodanis]|uniref:Lcl C-terminal domain-containing protein n=1 Tax=Aliivibrio wodanis TaxID=80852 RepID=UPI00406CD44B